LEPPAARPGSAGQAAARATLAMTADTSALALGAKSTSAW
jgi:hypothetical protein